ncbi:metalloregulator ArsR/SmtB family transcription factor [Exiguobacterium sp. s161]|uniref:ArsR/SmtB family transcription factor n=1 Tax=Exiguobacterium sp. s161 TaxID=2751191 RepID=UPI001BEC307C|nr:metalloregulator ArsR/SmtB family transcription factor [Exiguobacterium sp. s161]
MVKKNVCEIYCYDDQKVDRIQKELKMIDISIMNQLFKAIADENRAKIIFALCKDDELCVCDIANIIGSTIANTSHHLRTLQKQKAVKFRKEGKFMFYSLKDEYIRQLMLIALDHNKEVEVNV